MALRAGILAAVTSQMGTSVARCPLEPQARSLRKLQWLALQVASQWPPPEVTSRRSRMGSSNLPARCSSKEAQTNSRHTRRRPKMHTTRCNVSPPVTSIACQTRLGRGTQGQNPLRPGRKTEDRYQQARPKQYIGKWTGIDPQSVEGKKNAFVTQISKLPATEAIPILKNQWVLTWTLGARKISLQSADCRAHLRWRKSRPSSLKVDYGGPAASPATPNNASGDEGGHRANCLEKRPGRSRPVAISPSGSLCSV